MTTPEWLLIVILVALTAGFAGGRRRAWRNGCGEHTLYEKPDAGVEWWETAGFVTCLNIDHRASVRLVVGRDSVTLSCHGTDIEMPAVSVDQLISCAEQALPRLAASTLEPCSRDQAVNTQLVCDPDTPPDCSTVGEVLEMHWGPLELAIDQAVLPELIRRSHEARAELTRRLADSSEHDSDMVISCRRLHWSLRLTAVLRRLRRRTGSSSATTAIHQDPR